MKSIACLGAFLFVALPTFASAAPIRLSLGGVTTVGLGIGGFYGAFSIDAVGDTDDVEIVGTYGAVLRGLSATFTHVSTGEVYTFTNPLTFSTSFAEGAVVVDDPLGGLHSFYFAAYSLALVNYDLRSSIGPTSGRGSADIRGFTPTSGGTLVFGNPSSGTFTGKVVPVPEPASLAALGLGAAAFLRRRQRNAR